MENSSKSQSNFLFHEKEKNQKGQRKSVAGIVKDNTLKIGVSICGPKDQFNRKLGAIIATGRAEKKPLKVITLDGEQDTREVFFNALKTV